MKKVGKLALVLAISLSISSTSLASGVVKRYSGKNRQDVAVKVAKDEFSNSSSSILVNSHAFADALSASIISQGKMPILFTGADDMDSNTREKLKDFEQVIILGGKSSVSEKVEKSLTNKKVLRISGRDRYETNRKVILSSYKNLDEVVLATGKVHADALYGISYANKVKSPILLVRDNVEESKEVFSKLGVKRFTLIGGSMYLPKSIEEGLKAMGSVKRIAGKDRYEGSLKVLKEVYGENLKEVLVASGENFADPLVAGPVSIKRNAPIVLVNSGDNAEFKNIIKKSNPNIIIFGGSSSVSKSLEESFSKIVNKEEDNSGTVIETEEIRLQRKLSEVLKRAKDELQGNYSKESIENLKETIDEVTSKVDNKDVSSLNKAIDTLEKAIKELDKAVEFGDENVKEYLLKHFKEYEGKDVFESDMGEFEFRLSDKSFRKDKDSNEIYESEMKLLTDLRVVIYDEDYNWMDIKSAKGIEKASNLETLTISSNEEDSSGGISNIENLRELKKLKSLRLAHNAITDISPLGDLQNLEKLFISHNKIVDISVLKKLHGLKVLDISVNQIEDISAVSNLTNLEDLTVRNNQIDDITPVKSLKNLTRLDIRHNKFKSIKGIEVLEKLNIFYAEDNEIKDFKPVENLINLKELNLKDNEGLDIDVSKLTKLKDLNLENNPLLNIKGVSNLRELTSLNLSITGFKDIKELSELTELENLTLEDNNIEDISGLENLKQLSSLKIANNKIKDISSLKNLTELSSIRFNNNEVNDLSPLKDKPDLYSIESNNQVISGYTLNLDNEEISIDSPFKGLSVYKPEEGEFNVDVETNIMGLKAHYNPETDKLTFKVEEDFDKTNKEITTRLLFKFKNEKDWMNKDYPNYVYEVKDFKIVIK